VATLQEIQSALKTVQAIAGAIRELKRVPSGHLYTQVMSHMSLQTYNSIIATLVRAGVIEVTNHEIIWKEKA